MSREHGLMEEYKNNGLQGVVKRVAYYLPNHYVTSKVKTTQLTYGLNKIEKREKQIIISLTSYPARFENIHLCLKSLLMQTVKPDKIILWFGSDTKTNDLTQKMLELEQATYAGIGRPLVMRFLLLLAGETILLGVLVLNVRAAVPWSIGQLLAVLTVPFLTANNELLLLLRWVRPEWMMTGAVPLFAGQLCLLRFVQLSELPKGLPLAAGVLVLCMVLQCIRLAARSEYIAEG